MHSFMHACTHEHAHIRTRTRHDYIFYFWDCVEGILPQQRRRRRAPVNAAKVRGQRLALQRSRPCHCGDAANAPTGTKRLNRAGDASSLFKLPASPWESLVCRGVVLSEVAGAIPPAKGGTKPCTGRQVSNLIRHICSTAGRQSAKDDG